MNTIQTLLSHRLIKFALVGIICGAFQISLLQLLIQIFGIETSFGKVTANTFAFFASVQVNFVFSLLYTWKDRVAKAKNKQSINGKLIAFNVMMITSLVANQAVFAVSISYLSATISAIVGIIAGAVVNLIVSNKIVFAHQVEKEKPTNQPAEPFSLCHILPAYNEEENIEIVVRESLAYLAQASWISDFRIIIVNDGSKDNTGAIIDRLAAENPNIIAVHKKNGGYGSAIRAGVLEAKKTGMSHIHFMDADQQFKLEDLELFRAALQQGKTFVAGYRMKRADTFNRKWKGWLWTLACSIVMGQFFEDIDCAFKVIKIDLLGSPETLKAEGSTVNAEFILRASDRGAKFTHIGVNHYPRGGGKSSCEDMHFIMQSVRSLFKLRAYHILNRYGFAQ